MGLLDDAIREHLELKRRRGADPGEVAREQREVLDQADAELVENDEASAEAEASPGVSSAPLVDPGSQAPVAAPSGENPPPGSSASSDVASGTEPPDAAGLGETAELDMSSVLEGEMETGVVDGPAPVTAPSDPESLDWEMPGDAPPSEDMDQDDVLEETPDFLRETPEQERLWFEQRPPRDFDFDK